MGRRSAHDVTLFKSLGIAIEDLAAAHDIDSQARATVVDASVALGPVIRPA